MIRQLPLRRLEPLPALFYLGTHHPNWLGSVRQRLCVSRVRLTERKTFPRATVPWMLDSGAFSEIGTHGHWRTSPKQYAADVRRFSREIGLLAHVGPQDWMCEPVMLKKTGLTVAEHQSRTTVNYLRLRDLGVPGLFPVLQGWTADDYLRHIDLYERHVDLGRLPLVGVGSVCRRQGGDEIADLLRRLHDQGLRLHGFGVKVQGLMKIACSLTSADSMAWSYAARRQAPLPGCTSHINCANCERYALAWRAQVVHLIEAHRCPRCR